MNTQESKTTPEALNIRAFNGTGPALEIAKAIIETNKARLAALRAGIPEPQPEVKPSTTRRPHRRRTRAPAITAAQIALAIEGRAGVQSWKTIGRRLNVHPDSIRNAVAKARYGPC